MKLHLVVVISTVLLLLTSAMAQDTSVQALPNAPASNSSGDSTAVAGITDQRQQQIGPQTSMRAYEQQMQMVFQQTCQELDAITQAVYNGKVTREQAEYLSAERFELGMMKFQMLRTLYLSTQYDIQKESQSKSTELYVLGATVVVPPPVATAGVPGQMASYLDLSQEQIVSIQAQITEDRKQLEPLAQRLTKQERALESAITSAHFDEKHVQALAAEQAAVLQQLIFANAQEAAKLYGMLTTEQQARVDKLRENFIASAK